MISIRFSLPTLLYRRNAEKWYKRGSEGINFHSFHFWCPWEVWCSLCICYVCLLVSSCMSYAFVGDYVAFTAQESWSDDVIRDWFLYNTVDNLDAMHTKNLNGTKMLLEGPILVEMNSVDGDGTHSKSPNSLDQVPSAAILSQIMEIKHQLQMVIENVRRLFIFLSEPGCLSNRTPPVDYDRNINFSLTVL